MYISQLSRDDYVGFILSRLKSLYGSGKVIFSSYYKDTDCVVFSIDVNINSNIRFLSVKFTDFDCELSDRYNYRKTIYGKEWGQYVCDTLTQKSKLTSIPFIPLKYKQQYNAYWQNIRNQKIKDAESECLAMKFKK